MHQATFTITWDELTAGLLEKIKSQFKGNGKDAKVVISVKVLDSEAPLSERFESLFQNWKSETALLSSGTAIVSHPAYQQIIEMGDAVVPFILIKLREDPQHLFYALFKITGENPVPKSHVGDFQKMTADWLDWGKQQGYLS